MNQEYFKPDAEEIDDAIVFMNTCNEKDLVDGWNRIASEWDIDSIRKVHKSMCKSGKIDILLTSVSHII